MLAEKIIIHIFFYLNFIYVSSAALTDKDCVDLTQTKGTKSFLDKLYKQYGKDSDSMPVDKFKELMGKLSLGKVFIECESGDSNCEKSGLQSHLTLSKTRKRRATTDPDHKKEEKEHRTHWESHVKKCLKPNILLDLYNISVKENISRSDFLRICPSLIQQLDDKVCTHSHVKVLNHLHGSHGIPTQYQVWGYGVLSITVISLLSLSVISIIPCLKKSFYHKVMAYLVALAVGTLAGDAMLHLIPHAFAEGANSVTNVQLSADDKLKQHYSQVWRALFVLLGIYLFFLVEQLMKIRGMLTGGAHGHSHGGAPSAKDGHGHSHGSIKKLSSPTLIKKSPVSLPMLVESPSSDSIVCFAKEEKKVSEEEEEMKAMFDEEEKQVNQEGVTITLSNGEKESKMTDVNLNDQMKHGHEEEGYHADDRHHHHHHGEKEITKETNIASVAWMVIVGDGFHNFSDGLAVGAAFSASLTSGFSTAIAVFCHELPHELGDFAILINSGMTIKQAVVYNLVSAVLAYFGLCVGILIGEYELGRHFILSITAGLFLYVSLADMLPELTHQDVPEQSICSSFICQHLGMLTGIGIMLMISLFEHAI